MGLSTVDESLRRATAIAIAAVLLLRARTHAHSKSCECFCLGGERILDKYSGRCGASLLIFHIPFFLLMLKLSNG